MYYQQNDSAVTGSPLSPVAANMKMFEQEVLKRYQRNQNFSWDMLMIPSSYSTTTIYSFTSSLISDHLDSWQPSTHFTREIGKKTEHFHFWMCWWQWTKRQTHSRFRFTANPPKLISSHFESYHPPQQQSTETIHIRVPLRTMDSLLPSLQESEDLALLEREQNLRSSQLLQSLTSRVQVNQSDESWVRRI